MLSTGPTSVKLDRHPSAEQPAVKGQNRRRRRLRSVIPVGADHLGPAGILHSLSLGQGQLPRTVMNPHGGVFDRAVDWELPISQLQTSLDHGSITGHVTYLDVEFEGEVLMSKKEADVFSRIEAFSYTLMTGSNEYKCIYLGCLPYRLYNPHLSSDLKL